VKRTLRPPLLFAIAATFLTLAIGLSFLRRTEPPKELALLEVENRIAEGQISAVTINDAAHELVGTLRDGTRFTASFPREYTDELTTKLLNGGIDPKTEGGGSGGLVDLLINILPLLLIMGAMLYILSMAQGGGKGMGLGKSKAKKFGADQPKVTFADVAGCDEAVEELREIQEFLSQPEKFKAVGAKIPKGVLLFGPPGTGKTLLARAVAGEADAPFFSISGSDFMEMFVGVGASRVRALFEQAKKSAPAIIFVDEIDAVGRHRGAGLGGGHDEREQTLNQLLVEMDGFDVTTGVILIAATNRPDILDPALLRPGRFDRQIVVDQPDLVGREAILRVHSAGKPLAPEVNLEVLARRTSGFTGADLANLVNEAAILTARRGADMISMASCEEAVERVVAGPERKSRAMSPKEKQITAYHEAGHALVGHVLPNTDPIHKVSIIARGRALGWTLSLPTEDRHLQTRSELRDQMAMLMGGRTAEELIFGDPTTGAQNDIERATRIARLMVTQFGMSEQLGPQQLGHQSGEVFLGKEFQHEQNYSDEVAAAIDSEVRRLLDEAHAEAREVLTLHRVTLDQLADALIEKETLDDRDLAPILGPLESWEVGSPGVDSNAVRPSPTAGPPPSGHDSHDALEAHITHTETRPQRKQEP